MKTEYQIDDKLNKVYDLIDKGGKYFGMSYEEGVKVALEWVNDDTDELPIED